MNNQYIELFDTLKEKINQSHLTNENKTVVKVAILEAFYDVLQSQRKVNEEFGKTLTQLLANTIAGLEASNEKTNTN